VCRGGWPRATSRTPARKILRDAGGVVGFVAEDADGETVEVRSRATVVATGGFGGNAEWIKKFTGFEWGKDLYSFLIPGIDGDGIRMAWEAGAAKTPMMIEMYCAVPMQDQHWNLDAVFRQPNLMVNLKGERFFNEELYQNNTFTGNAVSRQKGSCAFMILDHAAKRHYDDEGFDQICYDIPLQDTSGFDEELERVLAAGSEHFLRADSIAELAGMMQVPAEALARTVEEYNHACDSRDALFNKHYAYLRPLRTAPFYAGRIVPSGFGSLGGIKINHRAEVQGKDFESIPGFYAAGTDANSIHSDSYTFILPGNTMGFAINSGRIAGESAAAYVRSGS
jgi:fumarate reductase flavoprotein subunit